MRKGNVLIAQSGGPTPVINNSLCGLIEQARKEGSISKIYGAKFGIQGVLAQNLVDLGSKDPTLIEKLKQTPGAALGSCRRRITSDEYSQILKVFEIHNIRHFFYIGGNDSMDTANKVAELASEAGYDLRVLGIPKTIDNDLEYTDHSPGYGSAARYYAISIMEVGIDVKSLPIPVSIFETMGRNSGWLAASTMLAKRDEIDAPHLIYVPEKPFVIEQFLEDVNRIYKRLGWVVVAVSEGLKDEDGKPISISRKEANIDDFGHGLPGDVSSLLADIVSERLELRARSEKPGLCARTSIAHVSEVDRGEAYMLGKTAVQRAVDGKSGYMLTLNREKSSEYRCSIGTIELNKVANEEKFLPDNFIDKEANGITSSFRKYARPLIGSPLPKYAQLAKILPFSS